MIQRWRPEGVEHIYQRRESPHFHGEDPKGWHNHYDEGCVELGKSESKG